MDAEIGPRIKAARRHAGLTQKEFGKLASVSQSYLSEVERGKSKPSIDIVEGIARYCPIIDLEWVLTGRGKLEKERSDYLGGPTTRRVTILWALFMVIEQLRLRHEEPEPDPRERARLLAVRFYRIAAVSMSDLELAYDAGTTDPHALEHVVRDVIQDSPLRANVIL